MSTKLSFPRNSKALGKLSSKQMLALLDEWFTHSNYNETEVLWFILTALRGPDTRHDTAVSYFGKPRSEKSVTTAIIRNKALPKLSRNNSDGNKVGALFNRTDKTIMFSKWRNNIDHFKSHTTWAAKALKIPIVTE